MQSVEMHLCVDSTSFSVTDCKSIYRTWLHDMCEKGLEGGESQYIYSNKQDYTTK